jgi:hypothetical protein
LAAQRTGMASYVSLMIPWDTAKSRAMLSTEAPPRTDVRDFAEVFRVKDLRES